jgi:cysteine desulfurase
MISPEKANHSETRRPQLSRLDFPASCYFDNGAATPMSAAAVEALTQACQRSWANPSSLHGTGREAREQVLEVERLLREELGAQHARVAFTGSGTEANNMALLGYWSANGRPGERGLVSRFEHPAILECLDVLRQQGAEVAMLDIRRDGMVDLDRLASLLDERPTRLVSVMAVNNELGTIQPIDRIGRMCRERKAAFHTDGVQAVGKIRLSMDGSSIDMLSLSGHKFHGPRGVGALVLRPEVQINPIAYGGASETLLRPGTQNVPGIVALGAAVRFFRAQREAMESTRRELDAYLLVGLSGIPGFHLNTRDAERVHGVLNVRFDGVDADSLIQHLDYFGVHCSRGSACSAASPKLSATLTAMGLTEKEIQESFRISVGFFNRREEIDWLLGLLPPLVDCLRALPDKSTHVGKLVTAAVCS